MISVRVSRLAWDRAGDAGRAAHFHREFLCTAMLFIPSDPSETALARLGRDLGVTRG